MHRLLNLSRTSLPKNSGNVRGMPDISVTEKTCMLCKQFNNLGSSHVRSQSTIINPNLSTKKIRKRRKHGKKYTDLLVVTENSLSQHKAVISNLTSSDLKLLANSNLNLSELYKLKELSKSTKYLEGHTYNNLNVIENISSANSFNENLSIKNIEKEEVFTHKASKDISSVTVDSEFKEYAENSLKIKKNVNVLTDLNIIPEEVHLESLRTVGNFQPEETEEHVSEEEEVKDSVEKENKALSWKYKHEITSNTLASYIEVCFHLRNPQRGLNALYFHRTKAKRDSSLPSIENINVYNALLKGFADKVHLNKIKEVLKIMEEDNIELNTQSYISIFECLGRLNVQNKESKDLQNFVKNALAKGITFDKMMNEGVFLNDDREITLQVMKTYDPNYIPHYDRPNIFYKNHLLDHLNRDAEKNLGNPESENSCGIFNTEELEARVKKQIAMERGGYVTVKSIECRETPSEEVLGHRKTLENLYKMWQDAAHAAFIRDLSTLTAKKSALNWEPFLRCIPVKDFVAIIIDEAKKIAQGSETYSPTVNMLYKDMGQKVYARYMILRKQKTNVLSKITKIHNEYCKDYAKSHCVLDVLPEQEVYLNPRQKWQLTEHRFIAEGPTISMDHQEWVPATLQFIGKFLYHIVMHDLKVDVNSLKTNIDHKNYLPAFYTIFRSQGRMVKEEVKPHPLLSKLYRASCPETLEFPTYDLPMLCPPVPWISTKIGGYLISPSTIVRLPLQASSQKCRMEEAKSQQLFPNFDALNQLGAVPWKVNEQVLDVILEVFSSGGSASLDVPEPPSSLPPLEPPSTEMDKTERYQYFRQKLQHKRKKAEMYSLWCDCLYRLSLANHFRNDIFWLPHNMDFRGRVYPIPPHLSHLGSDLARSILVFAEPRPLGPEGLNWLKIHLINLTGLKKRDPITERLKFANDNMDLILDSADNPLTGKKWWAESDEPWQTLTCCMEIANVVRSPDPQKYLCHFPIHQDGSCNGLQHYAALGRDSAGAYSVNLTPSEVPQDVYSTVVTLVEQQRVNDANNGVQTAKILEGFVKRKVIKQTIMTTVYGVTRFGARLQIAKQLKDIDDFPKESVWAASSYLVGRTFDSLRSMFTSTKEIQDWFTECARLISGVGGQYVEWVTPLGLPVVQPYYKYKKLNMPNVYNSYHIDKYEKPNVMKQRNAFPPNFIHSLDSSHMMLTSVHCERAGITFVSVHDCYWTHPSTVHIMNKICREQFVTLHSEPILENLSEFLSEKFSYNESDFAGDGSVLDLTKKKLNRVLRKLPRTGNFDINQVLNSVYFFS